MKNSKKLFIQANKYIPGGVNSPVRAFSSVNSSPFFVKKAKGQYLFDEDGNAVITQVHQYLPNKRYTNSFPPGSLPANS